MNLTLKILNRFLWIGKVNQANTAADGTIDYTQTMTIFAGFGVGILP